MSVVLDLVDEALDEVALPIQVAVILSLLITIDPRRDDRLDAPPVTASMNKAVIYGSEGDEVASGGKR